MEAKQGVKILEDRYTHLKKRNIGGPKCRKKLACFTGILVFGDYLTRCGINRHLLHFLAKNRRFFGKNRAIKREGQTRLAKKCLDFFC